MWDVDCAVYCTCPYDAPGIIKLKQMTHMLLVGLTPSLASIAKLPAASSRLIAHHPARNAFSAAASSAPSSPRGKRWP